MADVDLVPLNEAYRDAIAAGRELTQNMKNWNGVIQNDGQLGDAAAADTLDEIAVGDAAAVRTAIGADFDAEYGIVSPLYSEAYNDFDNMPAGTTLTSQTNLKNAPSSASGRWIVTTNSRTAAFKQTAINRDSSETFIRSGSDLSNAKTRGWIRILTSNKYTVDSNGFFKSASPIFRVANSSDAAAGDGFADAGAGVANGEAVGVTATHDDTGVYTVSGSLGFATEGWTITLPQDPNTAQTMVMVETDQADDGTITVRVYSRKFDINTASIVAGDPMDIPEGRWIDLRLSMPQPESVEDDETDDSTEQESAQ